MVIGAILLILFLMTTSVILAYLGFMIFMHKSPINPITEGIDWRIFGGLLFTDICIYLSFLIGFMYFALSNNTFINFLDTIH